MTAPTDGAPHPMWRTAEGERLRAVEAGVRWRRWGPYLSERQWGTVREDYSADGDAWTYLPHDHARSRAYRWGEDGIAGFCDDRQRWCLALGLWNGRDPILKERLFGLTNAEGNHGEDVKELYYYLDGTPTHSYMRMLYRYPQAAFPYERLLAENARRGTSDPEFEITDTDVFDEGRYFDVFTEYAKAGPEDILMRVTVHNRGTTRAVLHVLPQIWARNTWAWSAEAARPSLRLMPDGWVLAEHAGMRPRRIDTDGTGAWLFCDNDTNTRRLYGAATQGPFKDGINDFIVRGDRGSLSGRAAGTKCAAHTPLSLEPGASASLRLRLRPVDEAGPGFAAFDAVMATRRQEADAFYAALQDGIGDAEARLVHRQAFAGLLWSKQFYHFDVQQWFDGDTAQPKPPAERKLVRNVEWTHLNNDDILAVPDAWEYPWFAAWDLAFHCVAFAAIDPDFAKRQLVLLTREWYMHPSGQLPAYEWEFGDANPPVHAWAAWRVYQTDHALTGRADRAFLERVFHKLMLNFTWWVNRKDPDGRNVFQGGFLGLDNIGIFDRSKPLPTGGNIAQADGTAWMAFYALSLLRIALELALDNPVYEDVATKFFEHFLHIAKAMTHIGRSVGDGEIGEAGVELWDEADSFYYDVLNLPTGESVPLRVRSMVGLIPLFAVEVLHADLFARVPAFAARLHWLLRNRPDLAALISRWTEPNAGEQHLLSLLRGHRTKRLLARMLDPAEFLSDYGVRALSKAHERQPYVFEHPAGRFAVRYVPGESDSRLFGGNSNWRGPIWLPVNFLLIESLRKFHSYYGNDFRVECPVGSGTLLNLRQVADELAQRLARLVLPGPDGHRPVLGGDRLARQDPAFREHVLFYEYFHGDTGRGAGASHQTGWTALIALLLQPMQNG